jgi:hypothetical protein
LRNYDAFRVHVLEIVDMPERTLDLLFRFLHQNQGVLSKRARDGEFANLTPDEIARVEASYREIFRPRSAA